MNLKSLIPWKHEERPVARGGEGDAGSQLHRRMTDLFDFLGGSSPGLWAGGRDFLPEVDVSETDKEVRITAELPGLAEKDIDVSLAGDMLSIKGEKKEEKDEEQGDCWHSERRYGFFQRSVGLPPGIDADNAKAKFKNGVLEVTIPKTAEAQSKRKKIELIGD